MASEPGVWTESVANQSPTLIVVCVVFIAITTIFFVFRQAWRWAHRQRGWDDVMAAFAYAILVIQTIFGGLAAHYGFGKHIKQIRPTASEALKFFYLYQICYKLLGGFTKLTFCFLYLRIFNQKSFHKLVIGVASTVAAGSLTFALFTVLQCIPIHRAWDRTVPGHCINNTAFWYTHAAFNSFFDILIYIMPIPIIGSLKLSRGSKTGMISIFALGAFVIAASIVRMVMLRSSAHTDDPTWGSMHALIWTEIEANTSVVCCCLPALRVPFLNLWNQLRRSSHASATKKPVKPMQETGVHTQVTATHGLSRTLPSPPSFGDGELGNVNKAKSRHLKLSSTSGDTWYDRVLSSIAGEREDGSRGSSQDPLTRTGTTAASRRQRGAIYKTTDVHISMQELQRDSDPEHGREVSLQDVLSES